MSKYNPTSIEEKCQKKWQTEKTYCYDWSSVKKSFVIDTPPPTVSGNLHFGHIFSYTQTDILARFYRMQGRNVFYPMGWDDNGLPTEKRTQKLYGVRSDPKKAYDPLFKPKKQDSKKHLYQTISRKNFLQLCEKQVLEDEIKYKKLWNQIALSVDWSLNYRSIDLKSQSLSQFSFLDLLKKNLVENRLSPVLWDTQFHTAVAQADVEDRPQKGFYHDITFKMQKNGEPFTISTTRPELLPACVAVTAHPEDDRYKKFFGKQALTPLFNRLVPVLPSKHADPKKGTGILMVCTFGDMEDVTFCKKHKLPVLQIINEEGFLKDIDFFKKPFKSQKPEQANLYYLELKGLRVKEARKKIVDILQQKDCLKSEPKPCDQHVKFYEKGDFPLEILAKRQWYIKLLDHKEDLLKQGAKIKWHPPFMRKRYETWVEGLNQDWCISRQRPYGVPFPLWFKQGFKQDKEGNIDYKNPLLPNLNPSNVLNPKQQKGFLAWFNLNNLSFNRKQFITQNRRLKHLPIDPLQDTPPGFKESERDKPGGFCAETDVMDTWATSSLTPYINSAWVLDLKRHEKLFPADLRPQAHEIIRTWAFYSIAKSYFHDKSIPWKNIAVSGWVVSSNRAKLSKSKSQALDPENLIKLYSADAVRYWAGKARLGQDTLYDESLFKTGKRLVTKLFNAARFVNLQTQNISVTKAPKHLPEITQVLDQAWLKHLLQVKLKALGEFENYNYAGALDLIEKTFWSFCGNYLELVKGRVYKLQNQLEGLSGARALDYSLYIFLKILAPYLPYITEEIWQTRYSKESLSLHKSLWLNKTFLQQTIEALNVQLKGHSDTFLQTAFFILEQIRSQKTENKKSLASPLKSLQITASLTHIKEFEFYRQDMARSTQVSSQDITLSPQTSAGSPVLKIQFQNQ